MSDTDQVRAEFEALETALSGASRRDFDKHEDPAPWGHQAYVSILMQTKWMRYIHGYQAGRAAANAELMEVLQEIALLAPAESLSQSKAVAALKTKGERADAQSHVCKFEDAIDLLTQEGWQECACGKKQLCGAPYFRDAARKGPTS